MYERDTKNNLLLKIIDEATKRIAGISIAVILIAFCVGTWLKPDLIDETQLVLWSAVKTAFIIDIIWSRPVGIIAGVIGLLAAWVTITKKF